MREFCPSGFVDVRSHYYAPRDELIAQVVSRLVGDVPQSELEAMLGGHYITVWGPRQSGKTWVVTHAKWEIQTRYWDRFTIIDISLSGLQGLAPDGDPDIFDFPLALWRLLLSASPEPMNRIDTWIEFQTLFCNFWDRPVILILDDVDALHPDYLALMVAQFRALQKKEQSLLHGLALVGTRPVPEIGSKLDAPFSVQRSVHIPNLTLDEVEEMFRWYEKESGQPVEQAVIERVYHETGGQPNLVSWLGTLLTETYNPDRSRPITLAHFDAAYAAALYDAPNDNVANIVNQARQKKYQDVVLGLFRTTQRTPFLFDDLLLSRLYLNGVIDREADGTRLYARFSSPLVQKRLFDYFTREIFPHTGRLYAPFEDLTAIITDESLDLPNLLRRYERYLRENRGRLLRDVPRRKSDMRPYEAVFHFSLYAYLTQFLEHRAARVWPEFPTGNGRTDVLIEYAGRRYGLEVRSYLDAHEYRQAVEEAARYGHSLGLEEITLAFFIGTISDDNRARYEVTHHDEETGVTVRPVFVETGTGV